MKPSFLTLILTCSTFLLATGCATRPKQYSAPSTAKIDASSVRLGIAVTKSRNTASKARGEVLQAVTLSGNVRERLIQLKKAVPPEFILPVAEVQVALELATTKLDEVAVTQSRLDAELEEAENAKVQLRKDQTDYVTAANKLAQDATIERDKRIKVEKALSWYRWHWWAAWIVAGAGILICIVLAILKFTGRLML